MARTNWFRILLKTIVTKAFRLTIETVCELLWNGFSELHSEHFAQVLFYHKEDWFAWSVFEKVK